MPDSTTSQTTIPDVDNTPVDTSNSYYLHPSDSPGVQLVSSIFDGKGYAGWSRALVIALSAKNKLGLIDGTLVEPLVSSVQHKMWSRCNDMVISWILNSLSKDIADSVLYSRTARDIWKELAARFGQCNGAQLYQLQKELSDTIQGSNDIAGYYTKVKKLWDELDAINTFDHCSCNCTCGGKVKTIKSHHDGRLIQFLMGLNETYSAVKSNILMLDPLPTVGHAYSLLIQDEKQKEVYIAAHLTKAAFLASNQRFNNTPRPSIEQKFSGTEEKFKPHFDKNVNRRNGGKFCTHSKLTNHYVGNCYRLIGFPPNFKSTKSQKQNPNNNTGPSVPKNNNNMRALGFSVMEGTGAGNMFPHDAYSDLYKLLQEVKLGQQSEHNSNAIASANCAGIGPFNEEPNDHWGS
uniref:Putative ovule protein n=1 Tax=Solanum chacoense TaxID=4108 RepID=A0A0V0IN37_SOLCH